MEGILEPIFEGRTASEWAELYLTPSDTAQRRLAICALHKIGTGKDFSKEEWRKIVDEFPMTLNEEVARRLKKLNGEDKFNWIVLRDCLFPIRDFYLNSNHPLPLSIHKLLTEHAIFRPLCLKCLAETTEKSVPSISSSQYGGTELYGNARKCDICGSRIQTHWVVLLGIPLIPLGSYRTIHYRESTQMEPGELPVLCTINENMVGRRLRRLFLRHILLTYGIFVGVLYGLSFLC